MTIKTTVGVAVTTAATAVARGVGINGSSFLMTAVGAMFIGGADLTTGNGYAIAAGKEFVVNLEQDEVLYAIATANTTINIFGQGC